ncbi:uncharacterized protein LOC120108720 [Phoenix dactylifera]|uniref:Uncharacterized protein LOC120108720 n=1 Tax=Phoenix dactylifera TaxID=42345 RepID=A0A8B9A4W1_PHODC|nr:uncharacterized protein LOC120108720 [Phoenix dactylifera]
MPSIREWAGVAFVIRDHGTRLLAAEGCRSSEASTLRVESRAAWEGLSYAKYVLEADRIILEGDSAVLIDRLQTERREEVEHPLLSDDAEGEEKGSVERGKRRRGGNRRERKKALHREKPLPQENADGGSCDQESGEGSEGRESEGDLGKEKAYDREVNALVVVSVLPWPYTYSEMTKGISDIYSGCRVNFLQMVVFNLP